MKETKAEIQARIDEVEKALGANRHMLSHVLVEQHLEPRLEALRSQLEGAAEDIFRSVVRSHDAICAVKKMGPKEAYGQDPALYYALAICGEAGEMGNKIIKALRNGDDFQATKDAVVSEIPDVIIYSAVLAYVLDLDLTRLVNEKAEVVIRRALDGHYGGQLVRQNTAAAVLRAWRDGLLSRAEVVSRLAQLEPEEDALFAEAAELRKGIAAGETIEIASHCGTGEER